MTTEIATNLLLGAIALGTFFSGVGTLWIGSLLAEHLPNRPGNGGPDV